jgi:Fic family protein
MRRLCVHKLPEWPQFQWNRDQLAEPLASVRHRQGRLIGRMEGLGFNLQQEAVLETLTADVLKSSEIEGERLDAKQVRSSKYAKLAKYSQDTALRDILSLVERGILVQNPEGGRSTSYALAQA